MFSWRTRREQKHLLRLKPVLLVLMAQQERLDRLESLLQQVALRPDPQIPDPMPLLAPLPEHLRMQAGLLVEIREQGLELLQAMQPAAEDQLSRLIGPPSLLHSPPDSGS